MVGCVPERGTLFCVLRFWIETFLYTTNILSSHVWKREGCILFSYCSRRDDSGGFEPLFPKAELSRRELSQSHLCKGVGSGFVELFPNQHLFYENEWRD